MEKCKKHPKYQAIRKPQCDCEACWKIYNEKHGIEESEDQPIFGDFCTMMEITGSNE